MKLRTEMLELLNGWVVSADANKDPISERDHDAMAAHALLQAIADWHEKNGTGPDEDVYPESSVAFIEKRAAETLAGWMGDRGMNWQPIETAPRDSECVLLAWNEHGEWQVLPGSFKTNRMTQRSGCVVAVMDYEYLNGGDGERFSDFSAAPTHWMPLPEPPEQDKVTP